MVTEALPLAAVPAEPAAARQLSLSDLAVTVWLIGTIWWGKGFSYLSIGPVYSTELTLAILIYSQRSRIRLWDTAFGTVAAAYIALGWLKHGTFFFAVKDIAWLYYALFLRFFPRDFPAALTKRVIGAVKWKIYAIPLLCVIGFPIEKYLDGILLVFYLALTLQREPERFPWRTFIWLLACAFAIDFKTCLVVMGILPLVMRLQKTNRPSFDMRHFAAIGVAIAAISIFDLAGPILAAMVDGLSKVLGTLGVSRTYSSDTAIWRAQIWTRALLHLARDSELAFGQLPGFNFMDEKYLGGKIALWGGNGLGIVRVAHNIVIQMLMKSGVVGFALYVSYTFWSFRAADRMTSMFQLAVLSMAMTADVLEVPSRGPVFYCLLVVLGSQAARSLANAHDTALSPDDRPR